MLEWEKGFWELQTGLLWLMCLFEGDTVQKVNADSITEEEETIVDDGEKNSRSFLFPPLVFSRANNDDAISVAVDNIAAEAGG